MISVECNEYDNFGFTSLDEAVDLAKRQGIANAKGAINPEVLLDMFSLFTMIGLDMVDVVPGIREGVRSGDHITVRAVDTVETPRPLYRVLTHVESKITEAAGEDLPGWNPTRSKTGVRSISMRGGAVFGRHTDDYEGLVASAQVDISGEKSIKALVNGEWQTEQLGQGDITIFAGDTFSDQSRVMHALEFSGAYSVALTLGQDPFYTISGRRPFVEEHPAYFTQSDTPEVFRVPS